MQTQEQINATGELTIVVTDQTTGVVKTSVTVPNLVTTAGKAWIASRLRDTSIPAQMSHMAVGTSSTTPAVADTVLGAELATRQALITAGGSVASNTVTYSASFPAGICTGALTEAGIFNASSAGTLLCHTVFAVVNKGVNDSMTITWSVTLS